MKNTTDKTAVVIIPPNDTWGPIQSIREKHDRQIGRWMPHITLIYPFFPKSAFGRAAKDLSPACNSLKPFDIEVARFDFFWHGKGYYTVWLAREPEEPLLDLQTALWPLVCESHELERGIRHFRPHLSVGQVRGTADMARLIEELQANWTPIRFRVDSVHFIWRNVPPDDAFRVGRSLPLQIR